MLRLGVRSCINAFGCHHARSQELRKLGGVDNADHIGGDIRIIIDAESGQVLSVIGPLSPVVDSLDLTITVRN